MRPADKRYKRGCVDRPHGDWAGNPCPGIADRYPSPVMERSVAPRRVVNPGPAPGRNPRPMSIVIGSPADGHSRKPDEAVTGNILPITVIIQILIADDFTRNIANGFCTVIPSIAIL